MDLGQRHPTHRLLRRLPTLLSALILFVVSGCDSRHDASLCVGVASVDITPTHPVRLSGYASRKSSTDEIAGRLHAKALAISQPDKSEPSVLITVDAIGIPGWLTDELAHRLGQEALPGKVLLSRKNAVMMDKLREQDRRQRVTPDRLAICATHTHAAPHLRRVLPYLFPDPESSTDRDQSILYTGQLLEKLEHVARAALRDLRPGTLSWNTGTVRFANNRRVLKDSKWTGFGVMPEGPVDHSLPALQARDVRGKLKAVLATYACHCTTTGGDMNVVHGDWAGFAQAEIENRHPGAIALVSIGCGADSNPHPRGELALAKRYGEEIADEVDRLLEEPANPLAHPPNGYRASIRLDFDPSPSVDEWRKRANGDGRDAQFASDMLKIRQNSAMSDSLDYPIQTWSFGSDLAMVFLAGEVVVDHAIGLRRRLDPDRLWIHAYANDLPCYIASERLYEEGGYEVDRSMIYYGRPNRLAKSTEKRIANEVTRRLGTHFGRQPK
jgi:hypothetical protein